MNKIPTELNLKIFENLNCKDKLNICQSNKNMFNTCTNDKQMSRDLALCYFGQKLSNNFKDKFNQLKDNAEDIADNVESEGKNLIDKGSNLLNKGSNLAKDYLRDGQEKLDGLKPEFNKANL